MNIRKYRVDEYEKNTGAKLFKINNQALKGKRVKIEKKDIISKTGLKSIKNWRLLPILKS